jgi:hypothetical protein
MAIPSQSNVAVDRSARISVQGPTGLRKTDYVRSPEMSNYGVLEFVGEEGEIHVVYCYTRRVVGAVRQ